MDDALVTMLDERFTLTNNCEYANIFDEIVENIKDGRNYQAFQRYMDALEMMERSTTDGE